MKTLQIMNGESMKVVEQLSDVRDVESDKKNILLGKYHDIMMEPIRGSDEHVTSVNIYTWFKLLILPVNNSLKHINSTYSGH